MARQPASPVYDLFGPHVINWDVVDANADKIAALFAQDEPPPNVNDLAHLRRQEALEPNNHACPRCQGSVGHCEAEPDWVQFGRDAEEHEALYGEDARR